MLLGDLNELLRTYLSPLTIFFYLTTLHILVSAIKTKEIIVTFSIGLSYIISVIYILESGYNPIVILAFLLFYIILGKSLQNKTVKSNTKKFLLITITMIIISGIIFPIGSVKNNTLSSKGEVVREIDMVYDIKNILSSKNIYIKDVQFDDVSSNNFYSSSYPQFTGRVLRISITVDKINLKDVLQKQAVMKAIQSYEYISNRKIPFDIDIIEIVLTPKRISPSLPSFQLYMTKLEYNELATSQPNIEVMVSKWLLQYFSVHNDIQKDYLDRHHSK